MRVGAVSLVTTAIVLIPAAANAVIIEFNDTVQDNSGNVHCAIGIGSSQAGGFGCFKHDGDVFYVTDARRDGKLVAVHWKLGDGSRQGLIRNNHGWRFGGNRAKKNKNLPEHKTLKMRFGTCAKTSTRTCTYIEDYKWTYPDWKKWISGNTSG